MARTSEAYSNLAKEKGFEDQSMILPATKCPCHYIGSRNAKTILVYFHGGGYVMPASPAHLEYLYRLVTDINIAKGENAAFAVLVLAYSIMPEGNYPAPLAEAAECINHLVQVEYRDPSTIIIGGDSAGGNLALGLLSHLLHPHPSSIVTRMAPMSKPLGGAVVISPWVELDISGRKSTTANYQLDVSSPSSLYGWGQDFMIQGRDTYNNPVTAPEGWWQGLNRVVSDVLIWGGGGEVLIDSIKIVMDHMKQDFPTGVRDVVGYNMCHEEMVVDVMMGNKKGEAAILVEDYLAAKC